MGAASMAVLMNDDRYYVDLPKLFSGFKRLCGIGNRSPATKYSVVNRTMPNDYVSAQIRCCV